MNDTDVHFPTPEEIDAQVRAARRAQSQAVASMVKSAVHWLAHPRFSHRHA